MVSLEATAGCLSDDRSSVGWEWATGLAVVDFDVDVGHVLRELCPSDQLLSAADSSSLCFSAMPDSSSGSGLGDSCFAFRLVREGAGPLWGFSFFRSARDPSCKRGVSQRAVVLLTPLPLFTLFHAAVTIIGTAYFLHPSSEEGGGAVLREAYAQLSSWRTPHAPELCEGSTAVHLSLLGQPLVLQLVAARRRPACALACPLVGREGVYVAELSEVHAARGLGGLMWTLWQLLLSGESVVVLAPEPAQAAPLPKPQTLHPLNPVLPSVAFPQATELVLALTSLISPLAFMSDFRQPSTPLHISCRLTSLYSPYLSVHAPEWDRYGNFGPSPGCGVLFGATNPVLARSPPAWQSLLVLAEATPNPYPNVSPTHALAAPAVVTSVSGDVVEALASALGASPELYGSRVASWTTQADCFLLPDERLLRQLSTKGSSEQTQAQLLREHFEWLTTSFLEPLERFCTMGSCHLRQPVGGSTLMLQKWDPATQARFLKEIESLEPPPLPRSLVPQRAHLLKLYSAFLRTPHFTHWWGCRR
ncbi:MAG: hypothetical protein SGPRY_002895 [Prymnesium sp.]